MINIIKNALFGRFCFCTAFFLTQPVERVTAKGMNISTKMTTQIGGRGVSKIITNNDLLVFRLPVLYSQHAPTLFGDITMQLHHYTR